MGIDFQPDFLWAFLFGCVLVFVVAWRNLKNGDAYAVTSGYKVINELKIGELGGENALTRACFLYAGALGVVYIALTFFGKLILQAFNSVSEVGVQVDLSRYQFDSPQWPLLIAFGFAGVAPMLPPVQIAETWLRRRTYRAVGIPVRIEQSTRKILEVLHRQSRLAEERDKGKDVTGTDEICIGLVARLAASQKELEQKLEGTWLEHALKMREMRWRQVLRTYAELDLMIDWAKGGRGAWPGAEVPEPLRARERELVRECEERLDEILIRIKAYSLLADQHDQPPAQGSAAAADGNAAGPVPQPQPSAKAADNPGQSSHEEAADKPHRLSWLKRVVGQMTADRDNLVAILAIYAEKDTDIGRAAPRGKPRSGDQLNEPMLKWLLDRSVSETAGKGPDLGVFLMLLLAFPVYAIFMANGWHEISVPAADQTHPEVVLVSAGIETLRLAALISFPVVAAFAMRQARIDAREWTDLSFAQHQTYLRQLLQAGLVAAAVALPGLLGISVLMSFVMSDSPARFRELLSDMRLPIARFYLALAPIAVIAAVAGLLGADLRRGGRPGASILGLAGAGIVACFQYLHLRYFYGGSFRCPDGGDGFWGWDLWARECFLHYGGLDLLIYPVAVFLVIAVLGKPEPTDPHPDGPRPDPLFGQMAGKAAMACVLFLAMAQQVLSDPLKVGFRNDAEPFSYMPAATGDKGNRPYQGYLARLCYDVFSERYEVDAREVTLENRFALLQAEGDAGIDVLCDPVTLRLNQDDRLEGALFSPIVFASGVTYLEKRPFQFETVLMTYGRNSTAAGLASQFCRNDIILSARREQRSALPVFCSTAEAVLYFSDVSGEVPAFCRIAKLEGRIDCLNFAVRAEMELAKSDRMLRENAGHVPKRLKDNLTQRVNAWTRISHDLATLRKKPSEVLLRTVIQSLGACDHSPGMLAGVIAPYRFCPQDSHDGMIQWFCHPDMGERFGMVYLGDREIILAKHRSYEQLVQPCQVENRDGGPDLSYEPYVILVRDDRSDVLQHLQRRVHELFSDNQWAMANYEASFGERRMSIALAYLFLLNGVDPKARYVNTDPLADGDRQAR